jgi:hypothetical protein
MLPCSVIRWAIYVTRCLTWTRCPGLMNALFARHLPRMLWMPLCSFHRWKICAGRCPHWTRCPSLTMTLFLSLLLIVCILPISLRCPDSNVSPADLGLNKTQRINYCHREPLRPSSSMKALDAAVQLSSLDDLCGTMLSLDSMTFLDDDALTVPPFMCTCFYTFPWGVSDSNVP